jgi:hypothetical protein
VVVVEELAAASVVGWGLKEFPDNATPSFGAMWGITSGMRMSAVNRSRRRRRRRRRPERMGK